MEHDGEQVIRPVRRRGEVEVPALEVAVEGGFDVRLVGIQSAPDDLVDEGGGVPDVPRRCALEVPIEVGPRRPERSPVQRRPRGLDPDRLVCPKPAGPRVHGRLERSLGGQGEPAVGDLESGRLLCGRAGFVPHHAGTSWTPAHPVLGQDGQATRGVHPVGLELSPSGGRKKDDEHDGPDSPHPRWTTRIERCVVSPSTTST